MEALANYNLPYPQDLFNIITFCGLSLGVLLCYGDVYK